MISVGLAIATTSKASWLKRVDSVWRDLFDINLANKNTASRQRGILTGTRDLLIRLAVFLKAALVTIDLLHESLRLRQ